MEILTLKKKKKINLKYIYISIGKLGCFSKKYPDIKSDIHVTTVTWNDLPYMNRRVDLNYDKDGRRSVKTCVEFVCFLCSQRGSSDLFRAVRALPQ